MTTRPVPRRARRLLAVGAALVLVAGCSSSDGDAEGADGTTTAPSSSTTGAGGGGAPYAGYASNVYDEELPWICRPDLADDVCRDLDVTTIAADGTRTVEEREPAAEPPIDCFYVYPTVSNDVRNNSNRVVGRSDPEALTVVAQAAQFARSCRVFAPAYQQITLSGLGRGAFAEAGPVAYADVLDAWKTYITRWNDGRGVIVIGHSQGMGHLVDLLRQEVDDEPALRDRLVAAYLFGGAARAPEGAEVGGTFSSIPACTSAEQVGCVVTWSSWPEGSPPPAGGIFADAGEGGRALCVDAVGLLGRQHADPVAPVEAPLVGRVEGTEDVTTPFVALPDALDVSCQATETHDYLSVARADAADPRPLGSLVTETLDHEWGLHLVDMTVALDDLVELARVQGEAYTADGQPPR
ncbi:MAG TPA: DUF3089 domain-containing protein [Acidimicrobiales bacterium]|nr:DUF3089 domain-containing protein [Acidimicrobiales bacterium]